jgi:ATP-dependent phosphofructokinase / diphosphate-dependent phosphofructokinase
VKAGDQQKMLQGRLIVGQSGGCTHVMNASLHGIVTEARRSGRVTAIWGARHGIEGVLAGDLINLSSEPEDSLRRIGHVPAAALGSCRRKINDAEAAAAIETFRKDNVRFFIYIGGNDSADTAHRLALAARRAQYGLNVVCVPKTMDNDLPVTDHSPGYGSAARFIASITADIGMETEAVRSYDPVKIIEVKGRNSGWLVAASALAKRTNRDAPQFVWPPEVPFSEERFLRLVQQSLREIGWCLAVVCETIRDARGRPVASHGRKPTTDAFGHPRLAGAAEYLCELLKERLGVSARYDVPGSIQRMSSAHVSEVDLNEARACGAQAVRFALSGSSDGMVVMRRSRSGKYRVEFACAPLSQIANSEKKLPAGYFDRRTMLPTAAFRRYALPLVGPGLPEYARLRGRPVR